MPSEYTDRLLALEERMENVEANVDLLADALIGSRRSTFEGGGRNHDGVMDRLDTIQEVIENNGHLKLTRNQTAIITAVITSVVGLLGTLLTLAVV